MYYFLKDPDSKYSQIRNQGFNIWFWGNTVGSKTGVLKLRAPITWDKYFFSHLSVKFQLDAFTPLFTLNLRVLFICLFNLRQLWLCVLTVDVKSRKDSPFQIMMLPDLTGASGKAAHKNLVPVPSHWHCSPVPTSQPLSFVMNVIALTWEGW